MREGREAREAGVIAAVLMAAVIVWMLFSSPGLGAVADGSYLTTMDTLSLTWANEADAVGQRVESFAYTPVDAAMLLKPGQPAIVWPAALVRLVTEPFGGAFSTRMLAMVYALMIAAGAALAVSGLYRRSRMAALLCGAFVPVLMTHSAITAYLNSLYSTGTAIACLLLFLGTLVHALSLPSKRGLLPLAGVAFTGLLLLTSAPQMLVLLPLVAAGFLLTVRYSLPDGRERLLHLSAAVLAMLVGIVSVSTCIRQDTAVNSDAADYLAVFQGYLSAADDPAAVLEALDVDESYAADAGRSYYEDDESFVNSPRAEGAQKALFSHIGLKERLMYCLKNPATVMRFIEENPVAVQDIYNAYLINDAGNTRYLRLSPYSVLETVFGQGGWKNHLQKTAAGLLMALLLLLVTKWRGGWNRLALCFVLLFLSSAALLPFSVALTGGVDIALSKVLMIFMGWLAVFFAGGSALVVGQRVFIYLASRNARLAVAEPAPAEAHSLLRGLDRLRLSRKGLVWATALLGMLIICALLLPQNHVGGINNGDYGRMMEQIDINWAQPQVDDTSTQMGTIVVEDYSYREPFHPERLTPADPTYSLLFPSMLVRLWSFISGSDFSTRLLAFILLLMTMAGVLLIVHDLYGRLGRATLLLALGLVAMLLGENYVAWYNSLFGESSISTGLILTIACSVHLITMKRGSGKSWLWLILLAGSVRFLSCAKAQMALALPAGLILMIALAIYHHPKGALRLTAYGLTAVLLCGLVTWDTVGVYRKNVGVSEKQTVWQSVFYGALMVADDPDAAMEELGIDPVMKPDIGKHAYYPEEDYVIAPTSAAAEEALYAHVNTMTMVRYYMRHPLDLLKMLNRAAEQSVELHTGFMAYTEESYQDYGGLYRFNLWRSIRPLFACRSFWQYVLVYGLLLFYCIRKLVCRKAGAENRLFALLFVCVMLVGVLQFPLSVVGNGYADNNKQLYAFMLCHDLMLITVLTLLARSVMHYVRGAAKRTPWKERRKAR